MEFGTRELLIVLGALSILAILIDGVRRVRNSRYGRIRMSRRKQPIFDNDGEGAFGSELPNGGARVISHRDEQDSEEVHQAILEAAEASKPRLSYSQEGVIPPKRDPEQTSLGLEEPVPVLMEAVEASDQADSQAFEAEQQAEAPASEHATSDETPAESDPNAVIIFHLRAPKNGAYDGEALLDSLVAQGMRYGSMKIFHRHTESDGSGPVLFSMANSIEPGTFDLNTMAEFSTPGVSFFIALDSVDNPSEAFGIMLDTIAGVIERLGGELKDETRSAVTRQTVEHYWQRVREFERRALSESI